MTYPTQFAETWVELLTCFGGLLTGICAAVYGLRQAYVANRLHRSEMLQSILEKYNSDEVGKSIRISESGTLAWPTSEIAIPLEIQKKMHDADPSLLFFADLCYLKSCGVISAKEFAFFEWKMRRILADENIQRYLKHLIGSSTYSPFVALLSFVGQKSGWRKFVRKFAFKLLEV